MRVKFIHFFHKSVHKGIAFESQKEILGMLIYFRRSEIWRASQRICNVLPSAAFSGGNHLCPIFHCLVRSNSGSFLTSRVTGSQKSIGHKISIKTLLIFIVAALDVVFSTTALEIAYCICTFRFSEA